MIERVTARAGWDAARKAGRALGLAAHRSFLTYVAVVAAVVARTTAGGRASTRSGSPPTPARSSTPTACARSSRARSIFGMSAALHGAITAKGGAIEQTNFRDYPLVRIAEAPRQIHVEILNGHPPGGVGEPGVPPVAPAIANALFALTGKRTRELPLLGAAALPEMTFP